MFRATPRKRPYRAVSAMVATALAVVAGIAVTGGEAEAAVSTTFGAARFSANVNGSILLTGNSNLQCSVAGNTSCGTANPSGEIGNNNGYVMTNTDVDGDPSTTNSSTADLTLPVNSRVLYAGLYWSADTSAGSSGVPAPSAANYRKVKFAVPGGALTELTATSTWDAGGSRFAYQQYVNVTSQVAGARNGTYRVADIQAGTGRDRYAGWALVVAYEDAGEPVRSLRVFDGFEVVDNGTTSVDINVSGFVTPATGTVGAKIGTVVYEGDRGKVGDMLELTAQAGTQQMSDAANPANNFFNSTISANGSPITTRNPNWDNLMGVDIDQFDATDKLGNNATSATLKLTTSGETFFPGVVTFSTDLYAPKLVTTTTVDKTNPMPGDTVTYTIVVRNNGTDQTSGTSVMTDAIPTGLTLVPGSVTLAGSPVGDASPLSFALPPLLTSETVTATFQARVNDNVAPGTSVVNVPNLTYKGTNGVEVKTAGDTNTVTVDRPTADLAATVTVAPAVVNRAAGTSTVNYTATVHNDGPGIEPRPTATIDLPTGVTAGTLPAGCSVSSQRVTCDLNAIAPNTDVSVAFPATVSDSGSDTAPATLKVTGLGIDSVAGNDESTATVTRNASPQVSPNVRTANTTRNTPVTINGRTGASDHETATADLAVAVATPPTNGTTTVSGATITYTPNPTYRGDDTFTYRVTDPSGAYDTVTVTVTTANAVPVATGDSDSTRPGTPVTIDVLANDTDPNNDPRTIQSVTQPQSGAGTTTISSNRIVYTPAAGFKGTARFSYTVQDNAGGTATADVAVGVGLPIAANDNASVAFEGSTTVDAIANDTGPLTGTYAIESVGTPDHGTAILNNGRIDYTAPSGFSGPATFTYTIKDTNGQTDTASVTVMVANAAPVATNPARTTAYRTAVTLAPSTLANDPNGDPLTVVGTVASANATVTVDGNGDVVYTPNPGFSGPDTFTYTVSDGATTVSGTVTVTVGNAAPTAAPDSVTVSSNAPTEIDVLANDNDPNGDPLTITIDTAPANGTAQVVGGKIVYRTNNGFHGTDTLHYTISDGKGGTAGATLTVVAIDVAPRAFPDAAVTGTDSPVTFNVLANDNDPNGDVMTLSATTAPAHGTITTTPAGIITYTPATGFYGTDTFTYTVRDPAGNTSTSTVTVTVDNVAPNALDDRFTVPPGVTTELNVLANDTDPNTGQVLSVDSVGAASKGTVTLTGGKVLYRPNTGATGTDTFTYVLTDDLGATDAATVTVVISGSPATTPDTVSTASGTAVDIDVAGNDIDPDGGALTVTRVTTPAHGTALVTADGKVRYTPATGYVGTDTFSYTIRNTAGVTSTETVTVRVANAKPVAGADTTAVMTGKHVDVDVLANDTDVNPGQKLEIASVGRPAHGTATVVDGKIRYTPQAGFAGTDTFTYVVSDGTDTVTGTVTVTVSDGRPVAVPDRRTTPYQKAVTVPVLANDLDPDKSLALASVGKPDHGTAVIKGDSVVYTPPAGFSGVATFTYTAKDGTGQTTTSTVTITVGAAPVAPDKQVRAKPGQPVGIPLPAVDKNGVKITIKSIGTPKHGTAKLNANGTVTYTPDEGFEGVDAFSYEAVDADGNLTQGTITVTVAGAAVPPVAVKDSYAVASGKSIEVRPTENDSDPALTIVKVGKPGHGTAVLKNGQTVTYQPAPGFTGTDTFSYTVRNTAGDTARATVVVRVTGAEAGAELPKTGSGIAPVFTAGTLALLVGGVLILLTLGNRPGRHRPGRHRV